MQPQTHRLFFALWPDQALADAIAGDVAAMDLNGRIVAPDKRHITLHFLGQLTNVQMSCALAAGGRVQGLAFNLSLNAFQYIKRSGMVWLVAKEVPLALLDLLQSLGNLLQSCGIQLEQRGVFIPHLTLVRNQRRRPEFPPLRLPPWRVTGFCLIESVPQNGAFDYQKRGEWALIGD